MADELLFKEPTDDPTLVAARKALEEREGKRGHSRRVGGSAIGGECLRAGWMSFRWASPVVMSSSGLLAVNDGHRAEIVMADLLRAVPGVELWTEDPDNPGKQISFTGTSGHFVGKLDGVIRGLLQAPKTPHVWEHKAVNEKKFAKLKKEIERVGEKNALEQWEPKYFAQAQMYMDGMDLDRHYITVSTPGVRDFISVRTDIQPKQVKLFKDKAYRIVFVERIPSRISQDPAFFGCKFCDHAENCHGSRLPLINCRTCVFSVATNDGQWKCSKFDVITDYETQQKGCSNHRFHPDLVPGEPLVQGVSETSGNPTYAYKLRDGSGFRDDDKPNLPPAPAVTVKEIVPQYGDWYCTGCGVIYSSCTTDGQCDNCSGKLEMAK